MFQPAPPVEHACFTAPYQSVQQADQAAYGVPGLDHTLPRATVRGVCPGGHGGFDESAVKRRVEVDSVNAKWADHLSRGYYSALARTLQLKADLDELYRRGIISRYGKEQAAERGDNKKVNAVVLAELLRRGADTFVSFLDYLYQSRDHAPAHGDWFVCLSGNPLFVKGDEDFKRVIRKTWFYLQESLPTKEIAHHFLQEGVIDFALYEQIQASAGNHAASKILLDNLLRATNPLSWQSFCAVLALPALQDGYPRLRQILAKTDSVTADSPFCTDPDLEQPCPAVDAASSAGLPRVVVEPDTVHPAWRDNYLRGYWSESMHSLDLPVILEELFEARVISARVYEEAEQAARRKGRVAGNRVVLDHLDRSGAAITFARFLTVLHASRDQEQAHGILFDQLAADRTLLIEQPYTSLSGAARPLTRQTMQQLNIYRDVIVSSLPSEDMLDQLWVAGVIDLSGRAQLAAITGREPRNRLIISFLCHRGQSAWEGLLAVIDNRDYRNDWPILEKLDVLAQESVRQ